MGRPGPAPHARQQCPCYPHLGARQALSAFPLLQDEAHLGEELHTISGFPAKKAQTRGQQTLPEATAHGTCRPTRLKGLCMSGGEV